MPLNIQENGEPSFQEKPKSEPILHAPSETKLNTPKIVGALFALVVLAAIGFLLYTYGVIGGRRNRSETTTPPRPDIVEQSEDQAQGTGEQQSSGQKDSTAAHFPGSHFTIYIASYRVRTDAEEEVLRWKEAGFEAFVGTYDGWSRVALGHYEHVSDAKSQAEELRESFEQGYWIGRI